MSFEVNIVKKAIGVRYNLLLILWRKYPKGFMQTEKFMLQKVEPDILIQNAIKRKCVIGRAAVKHCDFCKCNAICITSVLNSQIVLF